MGAEKLYTTKEVANHLRLTVKTVRERILKGDIKAIKPEGTSRWRIRQTELDRLTGASPADSLTVNRTQLIRALMSSNVATVTIPREVVTNITEGA